MNNKKSRITYQKSSDGKLKPQLRWPSGSSFKLVIYQLVYTL